VVVNKDDERDWHGLTSLIRQRKARLLCLIPLKTSRNWGLDVSASRTECALYPNMGGSRDICRKENERVGVL
jgi:hypothetical protein